MSPGRPLISWTIVAVVTAVLTATSVVHALEQYRNFRSGWAWDLAYYNQWFWALTQGDGQLSVRPASAYAEEGPSVWKTNYLTPIRLALVPLYKCYPDPRTLLAIHGVVFWWVVPAAYTLVRSESRSEVAALSAACLVPLTPLLWPLAWNDFRELQMALPFVLWSIQGVRSRSVPLSVVAIAFLLGCRQEFAVMVATFAFLPPREPEGLTRTLNWRQALLAVGLCWLFFGFFAYLKIMVGRGAPDNFINQFLGPRASVAETLATSAEMLACGMGAWALLACLAPRVAILAVPWVWSLCNGRWAMRFLATEEWHHVRYAAPAVALVLAAGLVGYARLAAWLTRRRQGRQLLALVWILAAVSGGLGMRAVTSRMDRIPHPISPEEARSIRHWIGQVGPDDGVLATYEVTAPLSSRRRLYSYILEQNKPRGFPRLGPEFRWVFVRKVDFGPLIFRDQGFEVVHRGEFLTILRRTSRSPEA